MSGNGHGSYIVLPDRVKQNREWLVEKTNIPEAFWTEDAVKLIMSIVAAPELWEQRLMIGILLGELGYSRFWQMLMGSVKWFGWHLDKSLVVTNSGQLISDSHNKVLKESLERDDWDRFLWLEHDHQFPTDLLEVVSTHTDPIVGALYFNRVPEDPQPVAYMWNHDRTAIKRLQPFQLAPMLEEGKRGCYDVDVVPMGCTSIRRDVLEQWPEDLPWYHMPAANVRATSQMSDDVWFCRQAQEQGWRIKLDTRIIADHLGLFPFNLSVYLAWIRQQKERGNVKPVEEIAAIV